MRQDVQFVAVWKRVGKSAPVAGLIGAIVWVATSLVAAFCLFSLMLRTSSWFDTDEILGYLAAFAVAGTLSGAAAAALRGQWKHATATFVWLLLLLGIAAALMLAYPTAPWLFGGYGPRQAHKRVAAALMLSVQLGLPAGVLVALCVVAVEPLVRRGSRWALVIVAVLGFVAATGWGINDGVMWVTRMGLGDDWNVRREAVWGAAVGAIIGALTAALMGGIVGWALATKRRRAQRGGVEAPQAPGANVGRGAIRGR